MDPFRLVVFAHVLAATGLFAALAVEWASLRHLRTSTTYEQAREWSRLFAWLLPLGMPATLVALASGIYLATTTAAWELGWVKLAVPTLVAVAVAGAIVGPRRNRLRAAITNGAGALPQDLVAQLQHPLLAASWRFRSALLAGLLFEMTVQPDLRGDVIVMGGTALVGFVWSLPLWRTAAPHRSQRAAKTEAPRP
jgi:hypothetical protein